MAPVCKTLSSFRLSGLAEGGSAFVVPRPLIYEFHKISAEFHSKPDSGQEIRVFLSCWRHFRLVNL